MTNETAKIEEWLLAVLQQIYDCGYDIWGFDDGTIQVYRSPGEGFQVKPLLHRGSHS